AAGLQWSEIDFKARTVTIPAERMKGKKEHTLPLGPSMMDILRKRQKMTRSQVYVFPGLARGVAGSGSMLPIGRLSKGFLGKILDAEGNVITWSPHDLRRTALSVLE